MLFCFVVIRAKNHPLSIQIYILFPRFYIVFHFFVTAFPQTAIDSTLPLCLAQILLTYIDIREKRLEFSTEI